jgi:hypothetical protein
VRQFVGLSGCNPKGDRAACAVSDHASFRPIAAT